MVNEKIDGSGETKEEHQDCKKCINGISISIRKNKYSVYNRYVINNSGSTSLD